jgi:hypothetical protein
MPIDVSAVPERGFWLYCGFVPSLGYGNVESTVKTASPESKCKRVYADPFSRAGIEVSKSSSDITVISTAGVTASTLFVSVAYDPDVTRPPLFR